MFFDIRIGIMFDVTKPTTDVHEDIIALIQSRCKRLLQEMKQKTFVFQLEIVRIYLNEIIFIFEE